MAFFLLDRDAFSPDYVERLANGWLRPERARLSAIRDSLAAGSIPYLASRRVFCTAIESPSHWLIDARCVTAR